MCHWSLVHSVGSSTDHDEVMAVPVPFVGTIKLPDGSASPQVRPDVERSLNERVQPAPAPTVYNAGGRASRHLDEGGHDIADWPWSVARLHRELRLRPEVFLARTAARPILVEVGE
jgi:hypothetical protein